jgi:hypothetical protein
MESAPNRKICRFDLTGIPGLPAEIAERLSHAFDSGNDVEILNPSPQIQAYLRESDGTSILIRGSSGEST